MNDSLLDQFLEQLRTRYPDFAVVLRPYSCEEDESVRHFIHVLDVPLGQLHRVARDAWNLAFEVYGDETIPFLLTTIDPETAAKHFPQELAAERERQERELNGWTTVLLIACLGEQVGALTEGSISTSWAKWNAPSSWKPWDTSKAVSLGTLGSYRQLWLPGLADQFRLIRSEAPRAAVVSYVFETTPVKTVGKAMPSLAA